MAGLGLGTVLCYHSTSNQHQAEHHHHPFPRNLPPLLLPPPHLPLQEAERTAEDAYRMSADLRLPPPQRDGLRPGPRLRPARRAGARPHRLPPLPAGGRAAARAPGRRRDQAVPAACAAGRGGQGGTRDAADGLPQDADGQVQAAVCGLLGGVAAGAARTGERGGRRREGLGEAEVRRGGGQGAGVFGAGMLAAAGGMRLQSSTSVKLVVRV